MPNDLNTQTQDTHAATCSGVREDDRLHRAAITGAERRRRPSHTHSMHTNSTAGDAYAKRHNGQPGEVIGETTNTHGIEWVALLR